MKKTRRNHRIRHGLFKPEDTNKGEMNDFDVLTHKTETGADKNLTSDTLELF